MLITQGITLETFCVKVEAGSIIVSVRTPFICVCNPECACNENPNATLAALVVANSVNDGSFRVSGLTATSVIADNVLLSTTVSPNITFFNAPSDDGTLSSNEIVYISLAATFGCLLLVTVAVVFAIRYRRSSRPKRRGLEMPVHSQYGGSLREVPIYRDPVPHIPQGYFGGEDDGYLNLNSPSIVQHGRRPSTEDYVDLVTPAAAGYFRTPTAPATRWAQPMDLPRRLVDWEGTPLQDDEQGRHAAGALYRNQRPHYYPADALGSPSWVPEPGRTHGLSRKPSAGAIGKYLSSTMW